MNLLEAALFTNVAVAGFCMLTYNERRKHLIKWVVLSMALFNMSIVL